MPAKEVIAKAKEKGISLSPAYIYVLRSKGGGGKGEGKGGAKPGPKPRAARGATGAEKQFVAIALDLGFARAQALLDDVRVRIQRSI